MMHSPSTTPRTPRRVLTKSSNTTPGRYPQPITQQAPLPPLSLKPLPTTSYVTLIEAEFSVQRETDLAAIEYSVQQMAEKVSEKQKLLAQSQAELEGEKRRIEEETKMLGDKAKEMISILKKEKEEIQNAKEMELEVLKSGRSLSLHLNTIEVDLKEYYNKLLLTRECEYTH